MKCQKCGAEAPPGAKFCYNCGSEIKMTYNFCSNCGSRLDPEDNFCSICGEEIKPAIVKILHEQKIQKVKRIERKNQNIKNDAVTKAIFYGAIIFAVFVVFIYFYATRQSTKKQAKPTQVEIKVPPEVESKIYEIASKFACGCGACNELPLEKCDCNSAIQQRNFIKDMLMRGKSVDDVIVLVNERYGHLKPEYQGKYGLKLDLKLN